MDSAISAVVKHVRDEHARVVRLTAGADPYAGRTSIGLYEVLRAHFLLAEYFAVTGEGLGGIGPKDMNLLHSALFRQSTEFGGELKWKDRYHTCASLMYGLIQNHPFHDANKRTAFLTALLHLQKVGRTPTVDGQEFEEFTVAIADHKLAKYDFYGRSGGTESDKDVAAIAHFLRRNSRDIDLRFKQITYKKLNAIIAPHGLTLDNPQHNRIDLVRVRDVKGRLLAEPKRVTRIGFHAWTREVSAKDIHILRLAAKLDIGDGYDSQSFFNGVEGPLQLIRKYQEPLRSLAYR